MFAEVAKANMTEPLLQVSSLGKRFGGFVALKDIDLNVARGERVGLIGPNGSGKSTFVNCLSGTLRNESGQVRFDGHELSGLAPHRRTRLGLARTFQLPRLFTSLTVGENLRVPIDYAVHSQRARADVDVVVRCEELLAMVGLQGRASVRPQDLTQVEMRKLELARALAVKPKLLVADEAMAGLSHAEVDDILTLLVAMNETGVTIILIEHIMRAVMQFSQRLVVFVAGRKIADGLPEDVVRRPEVERAYLGE
jgi:branched-chain amino acid transport system ATP-binding protein